MYGWLIWKCRMVLVSGTASCVNLAQALNMRQLQQHTLKHATCNTASCTPVGSREKWGVKGDAAVWLHVVSQPCTRLE